MVACIKGGCIEIHWLVPTHCIDHAYKSAYLKRHEFHKFHLQYLQIGGHRIIYDPSVLQHSRTATPEISLPVIAGKMHMYIAS